MALRQNQFQYRRPGPGLWLGRPGLLRSEHEGFPLHATVSLRPAGRQRPAHGPGRERLQLPGPRLLRPRELVTSNKLCDQQRWVLHHQRPGRSERTHAVLSGGFAVTLDWWISWRDEISVR